MTARVESAPTSEGPQSVTIYPFVSELGRSYNVMGEGCNNCRTWIRSIPEWRKRVVVSEIPCYDQTFHFSPYATADQIAQHECRDT